MTVEIAIVVIVTVVIATVVIVTVVIVNIFSKKNFNILTTEDNFEGQRFAILAMFFFYLSLTSHFFISSCASTTLISLPPLASMSSIITSHVQVVMKSN